MGKKGALASIFSKLLVVDSPSSPASEPSPPWPWLSSPCRNPQTASFRDHRRACSSTVTRSPAGRLRGGAAGDDDMYKTANSVYQLDDYPSCFSPDDGSCFDVDGDERGALVDDDEDGFSTTTASEEWYCSSEAVIRSLGRASTDGGGSRFFVDRPDPLASNSILAASPLAPEKDTAPSSSVLVEESVAVAVDSADPYGDFRASMEEMVSAHGLRGCADLQELLTWYLRVNGKRNHALIVAAFVDLLIGLAASAPSLSPSAAAADALTTTTTTMMTTTSSGTSGSGSTSASSITCGGAGSTTTEQCCGGRGNDADRSSSSA